MRDEKLPEGIKPREMGEPESDQERTLNILRAMARYVKADIKIPSGWLEELADLYGE